jgi:cysteinyl-tRNA synthetase, unknown class
MADTAFKRPNLLVFVGALIVTTAQVVLGATSNLPPVSLSAVRTWAYQIQGVERPGSVAILEKSRYDLLVVEPVRTDWSSGNKQFDTPGMVRRLQAGRAGDGVHRRLVLAYLDIGEAEDWRWYWSWSKRWKKGKPRPADLPAFIIRPDPDGWAGNYPVAFWDPAWKEIVLYGEKTPPVPDRPYRSVLDEVLQSEFDGVYLDWVEAYDDAGVKRAARKAGVEAARKMIELIGEIQIGRASCRERV